MKKIALVSLGCDKNLVDTEVVLGKLLSRGYNFFSSPEEADILILNTCAFIEEACRETEYWLEKFSSIKKSHPSKKLLVMGCYAQRWGREKNFVYPAVDYWIGVNDFPFLVDILEGKLSEKCFLDSPLFLYDHKTERMLSTPSHYAYLKIAEGCNHRCSFCLIPSIRGSLRSRTMESVEKEALNLVSQGVKEIILVAQDLSSYGLDLYHRRMLSPLLRRLDEILPPGVWLRLLYFSPEGLDDEFIKTMRESPHLVKYLDIPLQHVDSTILRNMRRPSSIEEIQEKLENLRENVPGIFLRTTFLVGFPGEDEKAFQRLCNFVEDFRFERMGAFVYSESPDAPSALLYPKVEEKIKEERYQRLMEVQEKVMQEFHNSLVGRELEVIVDEISSKRGDNNFWGRTYGDAPEVDVKIGFTSRGGKLKRGEIVKVRVTKGSSYELKGEKIESCYSGYRDRTINRVS